MVFARFPSISSFARATPLELPQPSEKCGRSRANSPGALGGALVFRDHVVNHGKPNNQTYKHGHFLPLIAPHGHLLWQEEEEEEEEDAPQQEPPKDKLMLRSPGQFFLVPEAGMISGGSNYPPP